MKKVSVFGVFAIVFLALTQCEKDAYVSPLGKDSPGPMPYYVKVPQGFPDYFLEQQNALTNEGVELGKKLFFDPLLSKNRDVSCASCHLQSSSFSDSRALSIGTNGTTTTFHSMPIFNIAWMNEFFWDGRAKSREDQALQPVNNPLEMDLGWIEAVKRLSTDSEYPRMFKAAFGTSVIDSNLAAQAMVQYEMTLVSSETKFDAWLKGQASYTPEEEMGRIIFNSERGDCFHCHGSILATDNSFHNNGLDGDADLKSGLYSVTNDQSDFGKFKTPTIRNLAFTSPYMHDGRFQTLEQVVDFYSDSVQNNRNVDVLMKKANSGGLGLNSSEKNALIAFMLTMTDSSFTRNPVLAP